MNDIIGLNYSWTPCFMYKGNFIPVKLYDIQVIYQRCSRQELAHLLLNTSFLQYIMADENITTAASLRAIQESVLSSQASAAAAASSSEIASKLPPTATSSSGVPSNNDTKTTTTATKPSSSSQNIEFEPPAACIRRLLKQALPKSTNVSKDSLAAISRASGIFVLYLTACANDVAREGKRTTIVAKDVLAALKELEFDDFVPLMEKFLEVRLFSSTMTRDVIVQDQYDMYMYCYTIPICNNQCVHIFHIMTL